MWEFLGIDLETRSIMIILLQKEDAIDDLIAISGNFCPLSPSKTVG
jgi:hypothetical protein